VPITVCIPVKNGARYLREVLAAVFGQTQVGELDVLVIDSGSSDGSQEIATRAGARLVEIPPHDYQHGRTRNLGMELARGDFVAFLTQDATPATERWLSHLLAGFALDDDVGLVFGPHLPRPTASPMIERESTDLFTSLSPDGTPTVERAGATGTFAGYFSNVNSCISRRCWQQVKFRDVSYAEDWAFARDALVGGWSKVYEPRAAVFHSHDYGAVEFMRRYFDEYRGLREATGYVAPIHPIILLRDVGRNVVADYAYMRRRGFSARERSLWMPRALLHHAGRALFAGLGARAARLPGPLERRLSKERQ
jgi:glycosyltransferase involved in cell wall biosynthesis